MGASAFLDLVFDFHPLHGASEHGGMSAGEGAKLGFGRGFGGFEHVAGLRGAFRLHWGNGIGRMQLRLQISDLLAQQGYDLLVRGAGYPGPGHSQSYSMKRNVVGVAVSERTIIKLSAAR